MTTTTTGHTHPMIGRAVVDEPCLACEAEAEAMDLAQDISYISTYGIVSYVAYLQHCEREAAVYERCLVAQFADDPDHPVGQLRRLRDGRHDSPHPQRCAAQDCPLCQEENF